MENNKELFFKCRSPGKIIISGEHAVVYDMSAIACAIDLYTNCNLNVIVDRNTCFRLFLKNLNFKIEIENEKIFIKEYKDILINNLNEDINIKNLLNINIIQFIEKIDNKIDKKAYLLIFLFNLIYSYFTINLNDDLFLYSFFKYHSFEININSDIPHGAGLGSSAAFTINLTAAILKIISFIFEHNCIKNDLLDKFEYYLNVFSYIGEKYYHNKPSGLDNTVSLNGGILLYRKMFSYEMLSKVAFNNINKLNIFLIDSQIRRDTQHFIEIVHKFKTKHEKVFQNSINSINSLVESIIKILEDKEVLRVEELFEIIGINQNLLSIIQVSNIEIDNIINSMKNIGITGKITGAGGGGFLLAFVPNEKLDVYEKLIEKNNYISIKCEIVKKGFEILEDAIISKN